MLDNYLSTEQQEQLANAATLVATTGLFIKCLRTDHPDPQVIARIIGGAGASALVWKYVAGSHITDSGPGKLCMAAAASAASLIHLTGSTEQLVEQAGNFLKPR